MEKKMKSYLVDCVPQKKIPKNGDYDVAIKGVQLVVHAATAKEAKEKTTEAMSAHKIYVKPLCCESGRPLIKVTARLKSNGHHYIETVKVGNKDVSLEQCRDFVEDLNESMNESLQRWETMYKKEEK